MAKKSLAERICGKIADRRSGLVRIVGKLVKFRQSQSGFLNLTVEDSKEGKQLRYDVTVAPSRELLRESLLAALEAACAANKRPLIGACQVVAYVRLEKADRGPLKAWVNHTDDLAIALISNRQVFRVADFVPAFPERQTEVRSGAEPLPEVDF